LSFLKLLVVLPTPTATIFSLQSLISAFLAINQNIDYVNFLVKVCEEKDMLAIAKRIFGLKVVVAMPLAAGIAIVSTSLSAAQSQLLTSNAAAPTLLPEEIAQFSVNSQPIPAAAFLDASQHKTGSWESTTLKVAVNHSQPDSKSMGTNLENLDTTKIQKNNLTSTPKPGTAATSATPLSSQPSNTASSTDEKSAVPATLPEVAQLPVDPGRRTRGGSSYVGLGANIGLSGDTALGDGNFTIISKIGLTRSLALRPGVILGDNATFLLPLTYEFSIRPAEALEEALRIAPYVGAGVTIATGDDNNVGLLLTGGIDIPLSRQFTGNAALNVGVADETDIGLSVGVGYNFGGLGI
jgi:hypothetical protein